MHAAGGPRAVRDGVLLGGVVLAERPAAGRLRGGLEDRVVAEAATPARLARDPAAARPPSIDEAQAARGGGVRQGQGEDADVAGATPLRRQPGQLAQELGVVLGVGGVRAGVSARVDAGPALELGDLDPGIVGERRQAGRARGKAGLDPGIRLERQAVLDRLARDPEVVEGDELQGRDVEQLAELPELVRRAGRDDDPARRRSGGDGSARAAGRGPAQRRTFESASAWASNSFPSPTWARSSRASTRARSNGAPSAVPWSSTYVPASVPTTLKSTAARESSG